MTNETRTRARELRADGHTYREIGDELGIAFSTACRYCNPAVAAAHRQACRRWDRRNRDHKSDQARRRRREQSGRRCERCERPSDGSLCRPCRRERHRARLLLVQDLWARGLTSTEIGRRLGWTTHAVTNLIKAGRAAGLHFAYRGART